mgnify:FL=1
MASKPLTGWKRWHDAIMAQDAPPYIELLDLVEDANEIISDLLKGGAECTDQDKRQIVSRKKVKS